MTFHMSTTITWDNFRDPSEPTGQYHNPDHLIRAKTKKAAINKALRQAHALPCYLDRVSAGLRVEAEVRILCECNLLACCRG